jgi:transcriptional regulator with XRE-family HTH domain
VAFGRAVRRRRLAQGISQEQLALASGINRGYMGDAERGERNIALRNMWKVAEALGIPLSGLIRSMETEVKKTGGSTE